MKKTEIKQQILESQKLGDAGSFAESTLSYLPLVDRKSELDEFVNYFSNRAVFELLEDRAIDSVKKMIADKIFEVILDKNDIMSVTYTYLYLFYKEHGSIEDGRLDKYLNYLLNIDSQSLGDIEKCYVYNMRFVLQILRGDEGAAEQFLSDCAILHMHKTEPVDQANSVLEFLQRCEVPVEVIFGVLKKRFVVEEYLKLGFHQRRSIFNWSLHVFWNVPRYYGSRLWSDMYETLKAIFYAHLDRGEIDEAMYVHFFIYHKMGNIFQTQEEWAWFNEEISRKAVPYYQEFAKQKSLRAPKKEIRKEGKKKIGILQDRLVENSPFKVEYSLLKALMEDEEFKEKYEIKVYNMSYYEKSSNDPKCERKLKSIGVDVFDGMLPFYKDGFYHSHLSKAIFLREMILTDEVDILISGGAYDIYDFILSTRAAPKQIYWSHGNFEYDVDGIDSRITHISKNSHMIQSSYPVDFFEVTILDEYLGLEEEKHRGKADEIRSRFSEDQIILGSIGRLVKVDSKEYLETVAKIMHECPNTVYLACGAGNVDSIKAQVETLGIADRFYFEGWIDPDVYGYVIDVYLNTFPQSGGQSVMEYSKKNKGQFIISHNASIVDEDAYVVTAKKFISICQEIPKNTYLKMYKNSTEIDKDFVIDTLSAMDTQALSTRLKMLYEIAKYLKAEKSSDTDNIQQDKVVLFRVCELDDYTEDEMVALDTMLASSTIVFYSFSSKRDGQKQHLEKLYQYQNINKSNFISLDISMLIVTLVQYGFLLYIQGKNEPFLQDMAPMKLSKNIHFHPIYHPDAASYKMTHFEFEKENLKKNCIALGRDGHYYDRLQYLKHYDASLVEDPHELQAIFEIKEVDEFTKALSMFQRRIQKNYLLNIGFSKDIVQSYEESYYKVSRAINLYENIYQLSCDVKPFIQYFKKRKAYKREKIVNQLQKAEVNQVKHNNFARVL